MSISNTTVICIPCNTELDDGCDYTAQTIFVLEKKYRVFVLMLSQPRTWKDLFQLLHGEKKLIEHSGRTTRVYPFLLVPFQRVQFIKQLNILFTAWLTKIYITLRYAGFRKVFWFFEPQHVVNMLSVFRSFQTIYDMVDDFATQEKNEVRQQKIISNTDVIVVNSQALYQRYQGIHPRLTKVPLGFSQDLFVGTAKQLRTIPHFSKKTVAGFIGGVNYRLDFPMLFELAERMPEVELRFVGPLQLTLIEGDRDTVQHVEKLFKYPNVTYRNNQPKKNVPKVIEEFDICMIPYDVRHPFNRYSFPMKVMEYLYLGKPIMTTPILELLPLRQHLSIIENADEAEYEIRKYMRKGWPAKRRKAQREVTRLHTWEAKVAAICGVAGIAR